MPRLLGNGAVVSVGRSGVWARSWPGSASDAMAAAAIAKRLKRMENITIRLAPGCVRIVLDAQPTRQHQSDRTMPRLAFNRKDRGGESVGGKVPRAAVDFSPRPLKALSLWRYRGRPPV